MIADAFYDKYRLFLNTFDIPTPTSRSLRYMLVLRIMIALYGEDKEEEMFSVFRENRKTMQKSEISDPELYGNEYPVAPKSSSRTSSNHGAHEHREFNIEAFRNYLPTIFVV